MSTQAASRRIAQSNRERLLICGSAALTYGLALWIIVGNPLVARQIDRPPLAWPDVPSPWNYVLDFAAFILGDSPLQCLVHIAVVAFIIQAAIAFTIDGPEIDMERYRPYVFWRALYRFFTACAPFLRGERMDRTPSTALTEYERVTVRYFLAKFIFMPMMIGFFFGNAQSLIAAIETPVRQAGFTQAHIAYIYVLAYRALIVVDVAWFALGCSVETDRFSPIKTVDPYASGWLVTLACYPPFVMLSGQFIVWGPPEFPALSHATGALFYAAAGLALFTFYVIADICFGLKCGNLLYRGLVDKGPYRLVRHPMYASKNLAWMIFTLPSIDFHLQQTAFAIGAWHASLPLVAANWGIIWPMLAWMTVYALRGITEERYLLAYPEYQAYCKRVRYRFIPGVI